MDAESHNLAVQKNLCRDTTWYWRLDTIQVKAVTRDSPPSSAFESQGSWSASTSITSFTAISIVQNTDGRKATSWWTFQLFLYLQPHRHMQTIGLPLWCKPCKVNAHFLQGFETRYQKISEDATTAKTVPWQYTGTEWYTFKKNWLMDWHLACKQLGTPVLLYLIIVWNDLRWTVSKNCTSCKYKLNQISSMTGS